MTKTSYDYTDIVKVLKNIKLENLTDTVKQIVQVANKQKLKQVEVTETINFIKNNNEWKIKL